MTPERWREVKAALEEALELAEPARGALLARIGAGDPDLRREVEELLAGEALATPLTGAVAAAVVAAAAAPGEPGTRIGPYLLEAELGRGGMGAVYRARRADGQYEAKVAVKLARADLDGELAAARFRLERQYLAALEHPFIARMLDGGVTEDGRLYLVLELVDGVPIDDHCAAQGLDLRARLRLVRKVCAAVDYAHQRLIVHRDLKPSNVLVRADGTPKLVDFGIAKLLRPDAAGGPGAATQDAGRFLTPGYASPEQRAGAPVTTASDVYSLGVLLHELLAGCLPRPAEGGAEGALAEPAPVSVAAALAQPPAGPAGRRVDPRALRGDVDAIVARALRPAPEERYPTATALDEDLRRFLEGEPVRARRATLAYRARKFVRRRAIAVGMAGALASSLLSGGVLYAVAARTTARARTVAARRGEFLVKVLRSADPAGGRRDVTVAEVLDGAAAQLERDHAEDPAVAASLFQVLAETDKDLGRYPQAVAACDRALALLRAHGGEPGELADALMVRGEAQMHAGRLADSEASLREALAVLAPARAVGTKRAQVHDLLGITLKQGGREQEAEASYRRAIELYRALGEQGDALLGYPLSNLGVLAGEQGRYAESSALVEEGLAVLRRHLPPDHPDLLSFELDQAGARMGLHQAAAAEPLLRHVVEARARVLGPEHKDTLNARVELVDCLAEQGRDAEAAALGRPTAEALERVLGFEHPVTLYGWNVYATVACRTAQAGDGLAALQRVEAARQKLYGPADWHAASTRVGIGACLLTMGRLPEAEAPLLRAAGELEAARGADFHRTQAAYQALRELYARLGRAGEEERWAARIAPPAQRPP
jgi:eukaryotic-like serine/threonine-protein kinase